LLRIGDLQLDSNLLLAPISGYTDLAFRLTLWPLGGLGLVSTNLVQPRGLLRNTKKTQEIIRTDPADKPLCMQLYGREPQPMAEAGRFAQAHGFATIDINLGCPAQKIVKRHTGAALLKEPQTVLRLAEALVNAVTIPVTAKIRIGWDDDSINAPQLAADLEKTGIAAIIVHGRTAEQKFSGNTRLDEIARVVEAVDSIPVIGNGDVLSPQDAQRMLRQTGCSGVMIGRQALRDPWIFRDTDAYLRTGEIPPPPSRRERIEFMTDHFNRLIQYEGHRRAILNFRQRISWYTAQLDACREFRNKVRLMSSADEYRQLVDRYLKSPVEKPRRAAG
jgi:nifR3 family TIM-barrel protein